MRKKPAQMTKDEKRIYNRVKKRESIARMMAHKESRERLLGLAGAWSAAS